MTDDAIEPEVLAINQDLTARCNAAVMPWIVGNTICHGEGTIEMKFARAPIVIETESRITVLLNFDQGKSRSDRMDSSCRQVEKVTRPGRMPSQKLLDSAITRGGCDFGRRDFPFEADSEAGIVGCIKNEPTLFLSGLSIDRIAIRRVDLHGELLGREEILHQKLREFGRRFEPDFTDAFA